jgi:lipopolysaccharide export LptBFGC system permease protein LptF
MQNQFVQKQIKILTILAVVLTALSFVPLVEAFGPMPLTLIAIGLLAVGYILSPSVLRVNAGVGVFSFVPLSIFFGLFAVFQLYRIAMIVLPWIDDRINALFAVFGL